MSASGNCMCFYFLKYIKNAVKFRFFQLEFTIYIVPLLELSFLRLFNSVRTKFSFFTVGHVCDVSDGPPVTADWASFVSLYPLQGMYLPLEW
jgi:hypothetical protein